MVSAGIKTEMVDWKDSLRVFATASITVVSDGDSCYFEFDDLRSVLTVLRTIKAHGQNLSVKFL